MAFRWIHVLRRYDENREGFFYLFRFPFNEELNEELKTRIQPKGDRFFYPKTKAWHIAERHVDLAEEIILKHTGLRVCSTCRRGDFCKAWSHLEDEDLWERKAPPWADSEWEHVTDDYDYYEHVKQEWEDDGTKDNFFHGNFRQKKEEEQKKEHGDDFRGYGTRHCETESERASAQEKYQQWVNEQAARRARERAQYGQRHYDRNAYAGQGQQRSWRQQAKQPNFDSLFDDPEVPTGDQRWYDPGKRRDSRWAMRVLGLTELPDKATLKSVFRKLVFQYHPDRGEEGSHDKMALINAARDYLDMFISG